MTVPVKRKKKVMPRAHAKKTVRERLERINAKFNETFARLAK